MTQQADKLIVYHAREQTAASLAASRSKRVMCGRLAWSLTSSSIGSKARVCRTQPGGAASSKGSTSSSPNMALPKPDINMPAMVAMGWAAGKRTHSGKRARPTQQQQRYAEVGLGYKWKCLVGKLAAIVNEASVLPSRLRSRRKNDANRVNVQNPFLTWLRYRAGCYGASAWFFLRGFRPAGNLKWLTNTENNHV